MKVSNNSDNGLVWEMLFKEWVIITHKKENDRLPVIRPQLYKVTPGRHSQF